MPLTETAYAGLITCEPSNELYTSFSHTALHICDTAQGIDVIYNYGTFDFETPHFVWKFATRTLDYCLSKESFQMFMWEYYNDKRAVWEQKLKLTYQELCNLYLQMEFNYQPEYRYYRYDFFRDNCATRVRDAITGCLDHRELEYPTEDKTGKSYRKIVYSTNGTYRLWWRFAIDMALGARCDKDCSTYECAFLPLEMKAQFDTLHIKGTNETLTEPAVQLLQDNRTPLKRSVSPTLSFWALFIVVLSLTIISWAKGLKLGWLDAIMFAASGLISLLVMFMWFASAHYCAKYNFNILWASPLFIYFAIRLKKSNRLLLYIQMAMLVVLFAMIVIGWPQQFNAAILPIAMTLFVRLLDKFRLPFTTPKK